MKDVIDKDRVLAVLERCEAEVEKVYAQRDALVEALHRISLCSQNSASSREEIGSIARAVLARVQGEG